MSYRGDRRGGGRGGGGGGYGGRGGGGGGGGYGAGGGYGGGGGGYDGGGGGYGGGGGGGGYRGGGGGGRGRGRGGGEQEQKKVYAPRGREVPRPSADTQKMEDRIVGDLQARSSEIQQEREPRISAFEELSMSEKSKLPQNIPDILNYPVRPAYYGGQGNQVTLWTNYFPISYQSGTTLYRYDIAVARTGKRQPDEPASASSRGRGGAGGPGANQPATEATGRKLKRLIQLYIAEGPLYDRREKVATDFGKLLVTTEELTDQDMSAHEIAYKPDFEETAGDNPVFFAVTLNKILPDLPMALLDHYLRAANTRQGSAPYGAYKQALEIVLGYRAKDERDDVTATIGRKHYAVDNERMEKMYLGDALDAVRGYMASVRFSAGRLLINVQIKHAACYSRDLKSEKKGTNTPLTWAMDETGLLQTGRTPNFGQLSAFFKGVQVEILHLGPKKLPSGREVPRTRRILGLALRGDEKTAQNGVRVTRDGAPPSGVSFPLQGSTKTVMQYFRQNYPRWNDYIKDDYPVVKIGTPANPSYLPAQVCRIIPGQPRTRKLTEGQTTRMLEFAARRPFENASSTSTQSPDVLKLQNNPILSNFGLAPSTQDLMTVPGRVLPAPDVVYKNKQMQPRDGSWNLAGVQFIRGGALPKGGVREKWGCLNLVGSRGYADGQSVDEAMRWFQDLAERQGTSVGPYRRQSYNSSSDERELKEVMGNAQRDGLQLLIVLLPRKDAEIYKSVKLVGDCIVGMQTICVVWTTLRKQSPGTGGNIALKLNLKLRGSNNVLKKGSLGIIEQGNTMLVGVDVTHPQPGAAEKAPSIAALVATVDRDCQQYLPFIHVQSNQRQEMVDQDALAGMFYNALENWAKINKGPPHNVIIYRDGVSEGQYNTLVQVELQSLQTGWRHYKQKKQLPPAADLKFTLIVCGKRHNTRFYPASERDADRYSNPQNGTCVDRGVTDARDWDFFLQAHSALKGTAKPCHYVVLHDEIFRTTTASKRTDELINITHNLSYMYGRATKAVSLCPPAYYADRVCERARVYLKEIYDGQSDVSSRMNTQNAYEEGTKVHENIKGTMFFV